MSVVVDEVKQSVTDVLADIKNLTQVTAVANVVSKLEGIVAKLESQETPVAESVQVEPAPVEPEAPVEPTPTEPVAEAPVVEPVAETPAEETPAVPEV